ncbi:MAG: 6-phosphogluconolactonase [Pseudaminobacter sp.]
MGVAQGDWHEFASGGELAATLAGKIAGVLCEAIDRRGAATLAVSGGTTPGLFFRTLSREKLDWAKVTVTLVDERFVEPSSPRSNAGLVAANLLQNEAAVARFIGPYHNVDTVEEAARLADGEIASLLPLDVVVLGMGTDGHTASFFPDADTLSTLLDPASKANVLPVHTQSGIEPRLTLTLARIVEAGFVALHIEGREKRAVLEAALGAQAHLPVRAVFDHARTPIEIYWAP